MNNKINCSKYNIFNLYEKNEKFSGNKQFKILMKIINNIEIYEKYDLEVLNYLEEKKLIKNKKLTDKWKCYILNLEKIKFWQKFYLLALLIIFWLPFLLSYIWKYLNVNWNFLFYFYIFSITFWIYFLMKINRNKIKEHMNNYEQKYFN